MLRVLHGHSKSHSHFVANSCLLGGQSKNLHGCTSPTSGNLSLILSLLSDLCVQLGDSSAKVAGSSSSSAQELLLQWICQLLDTCKPCTTQLNTSDIFQRFLTCVVTFCCASASARRYQLPVHSVLSALLDLPDVTFKTELAISIAKTCIVQLRRRCGESAVYLHLLGRCPPQVVGEATRRVKQQLLSSSTLSSWVQNETTVSARNGQQFFDYILKGKKK